mmetsp:Transcript_134829/g.430885  ORF Transcript_134829/g.430885 Transcript_134829/m.430885 type:complete len:181 (-) Transcript_134829:511-1053(-)
MRAQADLKKRNLSIPEGFPEELLEGPGDAFRPAHDRHASLRIRRRAQPGRGAQRTARQESQVAAAVVEQNADTRLRGRFTEVGVAPTVAEQSLQEVAHVLLSGKVLSLGQGSPQAWSPPVAAGAVGAEEGDEEEAPSTAAAGQLSHHSSPGSRSFLQTKTPGTGWPETSGTSGAGSSQLP